MVLPIKQLLNPPIRSQGMYALRVMWRRYWVRLSPCIQRFWWGVDIMGIIRGLSWRNWRTCLGTYKTWWHCSREIGVQSHRQGSWRDYFKNWRRRPECGSLAILLRKQHGEVKQWKRCRGRYIFFPFSSAMLERNKSDAFLGSSMKCYLLTLSLLGMHSSVLITIELSGCKWLLTVYVLHTHLQIKTPTSRGSS